MQFPQSIVDKLLLVVPCAENSTQDEHYEKTVMFLHLVKAAAREFGPENETEIFEKLVGAVAPMNGFELVMEMDGAGVLNAFEG